MPTEFRSLQDVWEQLPTEDDARRFLEAVIWGETPICPHCRAEGAWAVRGRTARTGLYQCRSCRRQFTITTKTPMHATKLDLRIWVAAMFLVLTSSKGISSVVLARLLGVSQQTAWKMGHAIRELMDARDAWAADKLDGIVEVDEAFVGGKPKRRKGVKRKRGKGTGKPQILVAVQRDGQARAATIENGTAKTIGAKVREWVDPSATLMTDSLSVYPSIGRGFAQHHAVNHSQRQFANKATGAHINTAEAFAGQVERALVGVYHILPPEHLDRYLAEIAWRWHRRQPASQLFNTFRKSGRRNRNWKPVQVLEQMTELVRNAPGRQMRRVPRTGGLSWPERK